jgi:glycosyltransferase involved in cell wall biosynthesis
MRDRMPSPEFLEFPRPGASEGSLQGSVPSEQGTALNQETPSGRELPSLSVVIPIFNEEKTLPELRRRLVLALEQITPNFEVIFVDDGSSDASAVLLTAMNAGDRRLKTLTLSRNFGHQTALSAGIDHASGDAVVLMDGDLQDPPELIRDLFVKWREGFQVVYAVKEKRKEGLLKRLGFEVFYRLLSSLSNVELPLDAGIFSIMDRRTVDVLRSMPERNRYLSGLRAYAGGPQTGIRFERDARYSGAPRQTPLKLLRLALDALFSFSYLPLRLATFTGLALAALAFVVLVDVLVQKLVTDQAIPGWASVMSAVLLLGGVQLVTVGIIGEYIGRIFDEVKGRPYYVIERRLGFTGAESTAQLRLDSRLPDRRRSAPL